MRTPFHTFRNTRFYVLRPQLVGTYAIKVYASVYIHANDLGWEGFCCLWYFLIILCEFSLLGFYSFCFGLFFCSYLTCRHSPMFCPLTQHWLDIVCLSPVDIVFTLKTSFKKLSFDCQIIDPLLIDIFVFIRKLFFGGRCGDSWL